MSTYYPATSAEVRASTGLRPGSVALLKWLRTVSINNPGRLPAVDGGYNKRKIRGSLFTWSLHATGRAIDFGVNANSPEGKALGDFLLFCLMYHATGLGIQYIIWDGHSYKPGEAPKVYKGVSPHKDHLHIELRPDTADLMTYEWVQAVMAQK